MRSKLLLLSGVLATAGVIACGGGKKGGTTDFGSLDKDAQYAVAAAVFSQMQSDAQRGKNQLMFVQSVEPGKSNMFNTSLEVIKMITKSNTYGAMQTYTCPNGGTMNRTFNPSQTGGTYSIEFNNCEVEPSVIYNCTISGSWEGPQSAPTSANVTFQGGCTMYDQIEGEKVTFSNDLTWSYSIYGIGNSCQNPNGIKATVTINGGPMSVEKNGKIISLSFNDLQLSTDYMCTNANIISWGINGSMTYEDNFCANTSVSINISTNPDFYYDMSTHTCGGSMSINGGQVVVNANSDCSNVEVVDSNGQPLPEPTQTCQW